MRVAMIGTGYVGLVSGVCFSDFGHEVICVDKLDSKIETLNQGKTPIYEPGLEALMAKNVSAGRLRFTTDLKSAVASADAVFIAVGTPSRRGEGEADLSYVYAAAEEVAGALDGFTVVVVKSTVPVGTNREVEARIRAARPDAHFAVASNPEFLREGAAIEDFMRPDRVVVGIDESGPDAEQAECIMRDMYRPLNLRETPMVFTSLESAEIIKYAANAFLATKITFINEIASLCEKVGGDVQAVAKGMGLDKRIGGKFLHPGPGYGGSCFPKDTLALTRTAEKLGSPIRIVETVIEVNDARKHEMAEKVIAACGGDVSGRRIAMLGVTFKPDTDDMRDAPSLVIAPELIKRGAKVIATDPEGRKEGEPLLPGVEWAGNAYEAAEGADAIVIITEWNEFRALDLERLRASMNGNVMVDLRNIYRPAEAAEAGFAYSSVGRRSA